MPRRYDIDIAFRDAVQLNPKGYMYVRTHDFIRVLRQYNHHFTEQFAKLMSESFITQDGEAIEGESLDDVIVVGRVTFFVNRAGEVECPF